MKKTVLGLLILSLLFIFSAHAEQFKVTAADIPAKNSFINLVKAIGEETGNTFNIEIYPNARMLSMVENKLADFGVPCLETPYVDKKKKLNFDYSTTTIFNIVYVLYTPADKDIKSKELLAGNPENYRIERFISSIDTFPFPTIATMNPVSTFKKLDAGRIDGCIFAQTTGDYTLRKLNLKNIKRQYYNSFNSKFAIQKGTIGGKVDNILSEGIRKLKATGRFDKIFGETLKAGGTYFDWQP